MSKPQQAELIREEDVLSGAQVASLFPDDRVLARLLQRGVLQPERDGAVRVRFVGVAVAGDRSFQVIPKIFRPSADGVPAVMRQVIRALRRYAQWRPDQREDTPFLDANAQKVDLNALAIADWIIRDYLGGSIYRRLRQREEINGAGLLHWRRTIERMNPILSTGRPIYIDTVTRATARDNHHFVSRLHRHIVEQASGTFGYLLGYARISLDHEPFEPFDDTPPLFLCQSRIKQEMRDAYSDRAMQLLPMLLAWLSASDVATSAGLALYGVTAFHAVWEQACSLAIGNERERWQRHIPRPEWLSGQGHMQAADTFRPDIVTRIKDAGGEHLLIADAKYYQLSMPPALGGQPGVNEVAKQLWYERSLATAAQQRGFAGTRNIFIVPGPERAEGFWSDGQVSLKGLPETKVEIKRLSGLQALERYADGTPLDAERVRSVVLAG